MLRRCREVLLVRLEAYLDGGPLNVSPSMRLAMRRLRGFALIGALVIFVGGGVLSYLMGSPQFVAVSTITMLFCVVSIRLAEIDNGRYFEATTHAILAAAFAQAFSATLRLDYTSPLCVNFSILIILAANYILGIRAALLWTAVSASGVSYAVLMSQPIPFPAGVIQPSHEAILGSRLVVLLGTCAIAIAERRFSDHQSRELLSLASRDSLTGLLNRRAFRQRLADSLARARRHSRRVGLIFLDLDDFKEVNDEHGHAEGDALLVRVARYIASTTREGDCAGRAGGDEFVMLLEDVGEAKSLKLVAERMLAQIQAHDVAPGIGIRVSIGTACFPDDADDVESLMHAADIAMYQAKFCGGGVVQTAASSASRHAAP